MRHMTVGSLYVDGSGVWAMATIEGKDNTAGRGLKTCEIRSRPDREFYDGKNKGTPGGVDQRTRA